MTSRRALILVATWCGALFTFCHAEAASQPAVSATRVDDVPRITLYSTTPGVVAGRDTELDPTEPTLDLYLPPSGTATGAGVLILPGGGYQMLTVPGEGQSLPGSSCRATWRRSCCGIDRARAITIRRRCWTRSVR